MARRVILRIFSAGPSIRIAHLNAEVAARTMRLGGIDDALKVRNGLAARIATMRAGPPVLSSARASCTSSACRTRRRKPVDAERRSRWTSRGIVGQAGATARRLLVDAFVVGQSAAWVTTQ